MRRRRSNNNNYGKYGIFIALPILSILLGYLITNFLIIPYIMDVGRESAKSQPNAPVDNIPQNSIAIDSIKITFPNIYIVQMGVFTKEENSSALVDKLSNDRLPAIVHGNAPFRVYSGIYFNKDEGDKLAKILVDKGYEVYVKEQNMVYSLSSNILKDHKEDFKAYQGFIKEMENVLMEIERYIIEGKSFTIDLSIPKISKPEYLKNHLVEMEDYINRINKENNIVAKRNKHMELLLLINDFRELLNTK